MMTTFRDTLVTCRECGKQFISTVETQRRAVEQEGPKIPEMCEACIQRVKYGGKLHGHVKWFGLEKGYGFITGDDGKDVFFHRDGVLRAEGQAFPSFGEGQEVLYEVMDTSRGAQATRVEPYLG